jgi:XTP/dITP diphosphohydrolase
MRTEKSGEEGFGYDPIFEPENCGKTFAEMSLDEKNKMSHRARALEKMIAFLTTKKVD